MSYSFKHLFLLCFVLITSTLSITAATPFSQSLLQDENIWGEGKAEYTIYDATLLRYGIPRESEVRHILVREPFSSKSLVKANNGKAAGTYNVLKLNQIIRVPTGSYRYDQMHSSFWEIDTGDLLKFSLSSIDSCGNTYKQGRLIENELHYQAFTYWEGMDEVDNKSHFPSNTLFYDELPWKLRTLNWEEISTFSAPLVPSTIHSKAHPIKSSSAQFTITSSETNRHVTVTHAKGVDILSFEKERPYRLVKWNMWDGGKLTLRSSVRIPYWELNKPGDEQFLQSERYSK
ncbi:MAG: hypothetical protein JKY51_07980 [Opitutaceae bacterium]|nr:hypothetical protein [Opitutaceae bacterium]